MEPLTRSETLKYTFSQDELVGLARRLAQHQNELASLDEELNGIKADYKAKTSSAEAERNRCSLRITSGYEMRPVKQLVLKFRPTQKDKLIVRLDTGKARAEKMEAVETQLTLSTVENPYLFECDFLEDLDGHTGVILCERIPLTKGEAELLRELIEVRQLRKGIEAGDGPTIEL